MMMRNIIFSALLLLSFASWAKLKKPNYVPGEILVKYKTSLAKTSIGSHISKMGDKRLNFIGRQGIAHVKLGKNRSFVTEYNYSNGALQNTRNTNWNNE